MTIACVETLHIFRQMAMMLAGMKKRREVRIWMDTAQLSEPLAAAHQRLEWTVAMMDQSA